jgi:flagellar motor switch protein FliG
MSAIKNFVFDDPTKLSGTQKAAVLMISIGLEMASKILKTLRDDEVERITLEIARMRNLSPSVADAVVEEFFMLMQNKQYMLEGGIAYAKGVLAESRDSKSSSEMFRKIESKTGTNVFGVFETSEISNIVQFIQNEHPQVAALILSQIRPIRSAEILSYLSEKMQFEIAYRLASMDQISAEVINEIEEVIKEHIGGIDALGDRVKGGADAVASILNEANVSVEKNVIKSIEEVDPILAQKIRNQMFLFEDIVHLDDRTVRLIINEMDKSDMVLGLKGVSDDLINKFLNNMSARAKDMMRDDMEALGPVHIKEVEKAQQRIIQKIKQLEDAGQISTRKTAEAELVE